VRVIQGMYTGRSHTQFIYSVGYLWYPVRRMSSVRVITRNVHKHLNYPAGNYHPAYCNYSHISTPPSSDISTPPASYFVIQCCQGTGHTSRSDIHATASIQYSV
jgi:hypothetical protein